MSRNNIKAEELFKTLEYKGQWWLPENPTKRVIGTLTYTPDKSITLYTEESFIETKENPQSFSYGGPFSPSSGEYNALYGLTQTGQKITIYNTFGLDDPYLFKKAELTANAYLIGKHLSSYDSIKLTSASFGTLYMDLIWPLGFINDSSPECYFHKHKFKLLLSAYPHLKHDDINLCIPLTTLTYTPDEPQLFKWFIEIHRQVTGVPNLGPVGCRDFPVACQQGESRNESNAVYRGTNCPGLERGGNGRQEGGRAAA